MIKNLLVIYGFAAAVTLGQAPKIGNCTVLPADNIWNTPVDQLPVAPSSSNYINRIGATVGVRADFGSGLWNGGPIGTPFVTVTGSQTKYPVTFNYASESDPGPYAVPLNIPIEGGSQSTGDRHAVAIDTDNCVLYELFGAYPQSASWKAGSGAIYNLLSNALRPATWTSADAAGLPLFPGLVRYDEVAAGEIRHAMRFTAPSTQRAYVWPARHYASSITDPTYPPMGARFRLRANFDISGYSPVNQVILRAMKKYGVILADNGAAWFISGAPDSRWNNDELRALMAVKGTDFELVDTTPLMVSPDSGQARQSGVSVSVSPATATVALNTTRQFSAAVANSTDPTVTWAVNGTVGGNSVTGWVNATGLYTAPNVLPNPATVQVQATSRSMPSVVGSAAVTLTAPTAPPPVKIGVMPPWAVVLTGRTLKFTATVTGTSNTSVTWKVNGVTGGNSIVGTISSTGLYQAPASMPNPSRVTVSAVSAANPSAIASVPVIIAFR